MKKTIFPLFFLLSVFTGANAQGNDSIAGTWSGKIEVQGTKLTVVFHIKKDGEKFFAKMDSPDQGAFGIDAGEVSINNDKVIIGSKKGMFMYDAKWHRDSNLLEGTWYQGKYELPLNLRKTYSEIKLVRPQEPKPPFPYVTEEVEFISREAGIKLKGTLTRPDITGPSPAVILVTGSGPQNRDEELMGHKPFLLIADYLTRNGFVVLRYDERGVGESEGEFKTAIIPDFAKDAEAAFDYLLSLKYITKDKIGILGHSEGGMVAPMVAANRKDLAFIILLAGPGTPLKELLIDQTGLVLESSGASDTYIEFVKELNIKIYEIILNTPDTKKASKKIRKLMVSKRKGLSDEQITNRGLSDEAIGAMVQTLTSDYFRYFLAYDPAPVMKQVQCHVLALNGTKDVQVPAAKNLAAIENALKEGGNHNFTIKSFDGLNHLFQPAGTGSVAEYAKIETTIDPSVLEYMKNWMMGVVK